MNIHSVFPVRLTPMSVVDLRAETRAYGRARLRELALDAAREVVLDRGWSAVRMGAIATAVGISRQSLHAEFGTKDELGSALVARESEVFFEGTLERLGRHPGDLAAAVGDAGSYMLEATAENPLLQTILTRTAVDGDTSLLPLLTTRGEPLISRAADIFGEWVAEQWPDLDPSAARLMVDSVVRLALSHILIPVQPPSRTAEDLARLACRCVNFPDPAATGSTTGGPTASA